MSVTIKDVAKHANVAVSTASRVINDSGYVSQETREKVEKAVETLGYTPNSIARSLKQKSTFSIGLIVTDIVNPFYAELAQAVERAARERGYSVLLVNTDGSGRLEKEGMDLLIAKQVDGIIWYSPINQKLIEELEQKSGPVVVVITAKSEPIGRHTIHIDDQIGAHEAVDHLIKLGHKRIGYIAEPDAPEFSQERLNGYKAALAKAKIKLDKSLIVRGNFQEGSGRRGMQSLLKLSNPPTAVFAANDLMAIEAIQYIREQGLRVPEDVAVVGFDDIKLAGLYGIDLTTVAQPKYEMGREAAKILISSIQKERASRQMLLHPTLVVRKSCGYSLKRAGKIS